VEEEMGVEQAQAHERAYLAAHVAGDPPNTEQVNVVAHVCARAR
jgi:hypothetical protein